MKKKQLGWCVKLYVLIAFSCEYSPAERTGLWPKDLSPKEGFEFILEDENSKYQIHSTGLLLSDRFVVLTDQHQNRLDSFAIGECRSFYLTKADRVFIDVHADLRSSKSEGTTVTRLAILNNKLVPLYFILADYETSWDNLSKDSLLEIVSRTEILRTERVLHGMGHGLPDQLRMLIVDVKSELDTLGHVIHADTNYSHTYLTKDLRTGVYMERYLTKDELDKTKDTFDLDSIPYLKGEYYGRGQWNFFPTF